MAVLDDFLTGADAGGSSADIAQQLTERGGVPVIVPGAS